MGGACAFFDEHAGRLEKGLAALHIPCPFTRDDLARQILAVAAGNDVRDGACRLLVTAGPAWGGPTLLVQTDVRVFPERPLKVISYRIARAAAAFKSNSFVPSLVAKRAAEAAGADDAGFVDDDGRILEATTANCFVYRGGVLTTPPLEGSILPGVDPRQDPRARRGRRDGRGRAAHPPQRAGAQRQRAAYEQRARHRAGVVDRRRAAARRRGAAKAAALAPGAAERTSAAAFAERYCVKA